MKMMSIQVLAQYWEKRMILDICWCTLPESQKNSVSNITLRKQEVQPWNSQQLRGQCNYYPVLLL